VKDSFYKEMEHVFNKFPKYYTKISLGNFNAKEAGKAFLNQQLEVKVYIKSVIIWN
jgi:hypothetical protein